VYLVTVDDSGRTDLDFRPVDTVRWERMTLDIAETSTEQNLLDELHRRIGEALEHGEGRSLVLRMTLSGRGELHRFLRQPGSVDDLADELKRASANLHPFAWCERIEDRTAGPFDRSVRLQGSDFVADLLRLCDESKQDPELLEKLRESLSDLFHHWKYRRYLKDAIPDDPALCSLLEEAESLALNLLIEDDGS
jgi:hypothetical protein